MIEYADQQVHFAVVRNGYDRRQVDADVAEQDRRATEARTRIEQAETSLAEAKHRARALEAKVAELQRRSRRPASPPAPPAPVAELADRLLQNVSQTGRALPTQVLSEAEQDRAKIERMTSDVTQVARFRAARIVGSARREQAQAEQLAEESRKQVDQYIEEGRSRAEARAQAAWDEARARLRQPLLEVEEIRERGRAMRRELKQLRDLRDEWWRRVAGHDGRLADDPVEDLG